MSDSPRVRDQKALTTSSGAGWLLAGFLMAGICIALLAGMHDLPPAGAASIGVVTEIVLALLMITVRFGVGPERLRLRLALLAVLVIAICIAFFICAGAVILTLLGAETGTG